MIKAKKIEDVKSVWFEWDDDLKFEIKYLTKKDYSNLRKKATKIIFKRIGEKKEIIDDERFGKLYIKAAIRNWQKLKYKHLIEICEPLTIEESPEKEIEFSEENLDFIAENYNQEFLTFIIEAVKNVLRVEKEMEVRAEKNLKNSSNGAKVREN